MIRLLIIRHGESTWNAEARWQGRADPPLSVLGERQSTVAARAVGPVVAIWCSDLARAARTAEIMAAEQHGVTVRPEPLLRERDVGEWTGLTRAEIEEQWPGCLTDGRRPPGWEPDDSLLARALTAVALVANAVPGRGAPDDASEDVLVVTHGAFVRTLENHLGGEGPPVPNVGGRWVLADGARLSLGDRVLLVDPDDVSVTVPGQI